VTAVAPQFFHGDLRPVTLEDFPGELCRLEGVPVHLSQRIHLMLYGRRLREIMRGVAWDVVHCWEEPFILAGGQVARWTPEGAALVYATFQNNRKKYPPPFNWIERRAMKRASGWIAFGRTIEEALSPQPLYASRPHKVIPLGVDLEKFQPDAAAGQRVRRHLGWTKKSVPVIGFLGRFVEDKGLELLMRALDRVPSSWRALFVGSGPMEKELRAWGAQHAESVRVLTGIKHDEVPAYLNAMDVLCAPSQTMPNWREQLGRMLIEAFACGVPVVASDSGEIPFVVGDAGIILGEKDETSWTRTLTELLENEARRVELSARGLERARSTYAWPIIARRHLDFFDDLLEGRKILHGGDGDSSSL
jgi:glycosyltransferase involved in cell wall biosynthesis